MVFVPPHPLHWVSVMRNQHTPCPIFRNAMAELGRLLMYEASRDWLPTVTGEIQSPLAMASVESTDPRGPVAIVPILRAGLALAEQASSLLPTTKTYHLGCLTDFSKDLEFLVDPMLATGATIVAAIDLLKERGIQNKQIKVHIKNSFTGFVIFRLRVYTGIIDPAVNEKGLIVPGFGDAGDRS
ncbi:hypothetical protein V6N11_036746 [Hibiscus sabdariffa]|uniref:uracil phosphoribosyltransferase n=1 Tax=Hibiscus sabdariffa TaxID=183260 RepID=A0ABR2RBB3_9ROSI